MALIYKKIMRIENQKLTLELGDRGHFKFNGVDSFSKMETTLEFDCNIPKGTTYEVKDIKQSAYSVPFKSTGMKLTFTGVKVNEYTEGEPEIVEEEQVLNVLFDENDTDSNKVIGDVFEWNGVAVPYSVTSLCKQQTPLYFYNPNDIDVTIGIVRSQAGGTSYTAYAEWSLDGQNWTATGAINTSPKVITLPAKSYVFIRSAKTDGKWSDAIIHNYFTSNGEVYVGGNIASLLWKDFESRATTIITNNYSFYGAFNNMEGLTNANDLILDYIIPNGTTSSNTFAQLFEGCKNLIEAPVIPNVSTMSSNMYAGMFKDCTSLERAPYLPAEHLTNGCYFNMFNGCSSLNYISANFVDEPSTTYTNNWLQGVAEEGIFVKNPNATWDVAGNSGIPVGWTMYNSDDSALYTFGVLSDWHYGSADGDRTTNKATFVGPDVISNFYKSQNVDFMTLDGDLTYNGKVDELTKFKNMVAEQFGDMPFYYNQGNHDAVCADDTYESTMGVKKNFVVVKNQDAFVFASQDYTSTRISEDTNDVAYKNAVNWILETLEKYKGYRIFLYIHYCFYGMAGAAPGVSYGFKNGSAIAKSIVDKVQEVGNTIIFTGHTHFEMSRDQSNDGYVHTQELSNNCWMVHIPSCGWCKTGDGKGENNCIKDPYPQDTTYGKIYRSQGYVAEAYPDRVVLKAYQFNTNEWLGDYVFNVSGVKNIVGASLVGNEHNIPEIPEGEDHVVLEDGVYVNSVYWQTDYNTTATDTMEWKGQFTKTSQYLMGTADSSSSKRFDVQYTSKNQIQVGLNTNSYKNGTQNLLDNQPHTLTFNTTDCKVDGRVVATNTSLVYAQPTAPIRICSIAGNAYSADTAHLFIGRFYEASVYDEDMNYKRHWVPVYHKDGTFKLYETVNNVYVETSGDGEIYWK